MFKDDPQLVAILQGGKRKVARPVERKDVITCEIMKKLHASFSGETGYMSVLDHRTMLYALLAYAA